MVPSKKDWPGAKVELVALETLVPYARNPRTHSDAQVAEIAASMKEWGWTNPVLVDDEGLIIAGHGRVLAARKLGFEQVPVMVANGWTEAQKKAYVIADNQLALNAGWDLDVLGNEVRELDALGFDLSLTGLGDLDSLLAEPGTQGFTDPNAAPEPPETPTACPGDVWFLGRHRICCGDATSADDVAKALHGVEPHLMVTDPPYGVNYDADWRNRALRADGSSIAGRAVGKVENDDRADWGEAWALFPGDVAYVWHGPLHAATVQESLERAGFAMRTHIIWNKTAFVISRGDYHYRHEPCWYAVRKGKKGHWAGDRKQTTVWDINHRRSETGHSTQKPVECMKRPIENNSSPGQAVYDPFLGSGTTLIAAEMTGRACHGLELNPAYVDVIIKRWQDLTGLLAKHEDGQTFNEKSNGAETARAD